MNLILIKVYLKGDNLSIVRRDEFDEYLRSLANKYAKLYFGRFITIKDKKAIIKIDNKKEAFEFDILIGADGVNSTVRKAINLEPIPKILTYFAKIDKKQNILNFTLIKNLEEIIMRGLFLMRI